MRVRCVIVAAAVGGLAAASCASIPANDSGGDVPGDSACLFGIPVLLEHTLFDLQFMTMQRELLASGIPNAGVSSRILDETMSFQDLADLFEPGVSIPRDFYSGPLGVRQAYLNIADRLTGPGGPVHVDEIEVRTMEQVCAREGVSSREFVCSEMAKVIDRLDEAALNSACLAIPFSVQDGWDPIEGSDAG